jgi:hypothetical protein
MHDACPRGRQRARPASYIHCMPLMRCRTQSVPYRRPPIPVQAATRLLNITGPFILFRNSELVHPAFNMNPFFSAIIASLLYLTTVVAYCTSPDRCWDLKEFKSLVTFGDSYTDESRLDYFASNGQAPPAGWVPPFVRFFSLHLFLMSMSISSPTRECPFGSPSYSFASYPRFSQRGCLVIQNTSEI